MIVSSNVVIDYVPHFYAFFFFFGSCSNKPVDLRCKMVPCQDERLSGGRIRNIKLICQFKFGIQWEMKQYTGSEGTIL